MNEEKNNLLTIKEITINEFEEKFIEVYNELFPKDERRKWENIKETYEQNIEKFYMLEYGLEDVGFIMLEKLEDRPYYIDYFAIRKEHQGRGFGSKAMKVLLEDVIKDDTLCFEIEKENQDKPNTIRRASFYKALDCKEVDSTYNLFNVLYTPYYWSKTKTYTIEEIDKIMFEYYEMNCSKELTQKYCKKC